MSGMKAERIACVRCDRKDPEANGFQFREEGYVCCVCLVKQEQDYQKMLAERPWERS